MLKDVGPVPNYPVQKLTLNCLSFIFQIQTFLGSVISPDSAEAAAVAGDAR